MNLPDLFILNEFSDIPPKFYSDATGKPFENCLVCERDLLVSGTQYVVEKALKNYENFNTSDTIFEYAMCFQCLENFRDNVSDESRQRIDAYFAENVDLVKRRHTFLEADNLDAADWTSNCIVNGKLDSKCSEYQIYCQCDGSKMLFTYMPFMISGDAMDDIVQLLSKKTIGDIGGFMNEYFDVPPELKINPVDHPVLIF